MKLYVTIRKIFKILGVVAHVVGLTTFLVGSCLSIDNALSQTATVTASTGQTCAGTRFGSNLGCTANDFSSTLTFDQPAATAISSCMAGQQVTIDVIASITSSSPARYDGGFFVGENGISPNLNTAASSCSVAVFPSSPLPFQNLDGNACGDYAATSSSTLLIKGVKVNCTPSPGTNLVAVPYTLVFSNLAGPASCSVANITAKTTSKCVSSNNSTATGLVVNGFLKVTKQTNPVGEPQSFSFTTSSTSTQSPSSFSLTDGASQFVQVPFSSTGSGQTLTVAETATSGWGPNTSIICLTPSGASASSYVAVDNVARTITATLTPTNYGANCTFTNTKIPTVKIVKTTLGGFGGPFNFVATNLTSNPAAITTTTAATTTPSNPSAIAATTIGTAITITEPKIGGFFLSSASCTDANSAHTGNSGSVGSLSGTLLTIPASNVVAGSDYTCLFSNTKEAPQLSVVKTASSAGPFSVGQFITYTYKVTNTGNVVMMVVSVADTHNGTGTFLGPKNEALTTDVDPVGDSTDASGNNGVWDSLGPGDTVTFTATYTVTQHDVDYLQ